MAALRTILALCLLCGISGIGSGDGGGYILSQPGVSVIDLTETTVTLQFSLPPEEADTIAKFRVEYGVSVVQITATKPGAPAELRIYNLRPSTSYKFRVQAMTSSAHEHATEFIVTTKEPSRPYPAQLTSDPQGRYTDQYTATWERPRTGGMPIRQYKYRYTRVLVDEAGNLEKPLEHWMQLTHMYYDDQMPMLKHKIMGLQPGSHYQLEVTFRNDIGWSDPSLMIFQTAQIGPDAEHRPTGSTPVSGTTSVGPVNIMLLLVVMQCVGHVL